MSDTISIRIDSETKAQLGALALATRRSKSYLAAAAVTAYVARERSIIEGIARGKVDMAAGRTVPHEEAMAEIDALIEKAARGEHG